MASLDKPHLPCRAEFAADQLADRPDTQRLEPNRVCPVVLSDRRDWLFATVLGGPRRRDHKDGKLGDTT